MAEIKENQSSYRSIFKATSLFGGVQVYNIIIQVIRSKFVAILLGPVGVGIQGLYHSAMDMVSQFSSMGLSQSAVRDISAANATKDMARISRTITVLRRLVWYTGLFGALILLLGSPIFSKLSFGNYDYTLPIACLSVCLLLDQISAGQKVLLQGMRRLKDLAKASTLGMTIGLLCSVPLYYWLGVNGIVPTFILHSLTSLLLSWYFAKNISTEKVQITARQTFAEGEIMLKLGIAMSFSGILVALCSYILRGYISHKSGPEMVGLFTSGFLITNSYVGLIFNAMRSDFYPRLAGVAHDNERCNEVVSQQGEIGALLLGPLVTVCIIFMPLMINILYSDKFLLAIDYITWAVVGMMFRLVAWLVSIQFVAKGDSRQFIINETIVNAYSLLLNIIFFEFWGLTGLGVSFVVIYILYSLQVFYVCNHKYQFKFSNGFIKIFLVEMILVVLAILVTIFPNIYCRYIFGSLAIVAVGIYSLLQLDKKMNLRKIMKK